MEIPVPVRTPPFETDAQAPVGDSFVRILLPTSLLTVRFPTTRVAVDDETTRTLAWLLDRVIQQVVAHGGTVMGANHATVEARWSSDTEEPSLLVRRASSCALAVTELLGESTAPPHILPSLGVGFGNACTATVGASLVVIGPARLDAEAAAAGPAQQVHLGPEAWRLVASQASGRTFPGGATWLRRLDTRISPLAPTDSRPTPPDDWSREWLHLSSVTIHLANLSCTPPTLPTVHLAAGIVQDILDSHGARLHGVDTSEHCLLLHAVLTPSLSAHSNHALRALSLAFQIRDRLAEAGLSSRIGIATGRVLQRQETPALTGPLLVGCALGRSQVLAQSSASRIAVDGDTFRLTSHRVQYTPLPANPVESPPGDLDAPAPAAAWSAEALLHGKGVLTTRTPMFGREEESRRIRLAIEGMRSDTSRVIVLQGEAGIGKTRVLAEARDVAERAGFRVFFGAGAVVGGRDPYHPWIQVFHDFFGLREGDSVQVRMEKVTSALADLTGASTLAPLLNPIVGLDLPDTPETRVLTGQPRVDRTVDLLCWLLQMRAQDQRIAIFLEDAHLADSASWSMAWRLTTWVNPYLLVLATRPLPEPVPAAFRHLLRVPGAIVLQLAGLGYPSIRDMVNDVLEVDQCPMALVEWIATIGEGNPFFTREIALYMRHHPELTREGRRISAFPLSLLRNMRMPAPVQAVASWRVSALPAPVLRVLKAASVLGVEFDAELLAHLLGGSPDLRALLDMLEDMVDADVLAPALQGARPGYTFQHHLLHDAVYALLTMDQRRRMHRQVAEVLERRTDTTHATDVLLAHHWVAAGDTDKSLEYLERAGDSASAGGALDEAIDLYTRALDLEQPQRHPRFTIPTPQRARLMTRLGEALHLLGDRPASRVWLGRGLRQLGFAAPTHRWIQLPSICWHLAGQFVHAFLPERLRRGRRSRRGTYLEAARCLELLAESWFFDDQTAWLAANLRAVNLADAAGLPYEVVRPFGTVAFLWGVMGLHRLSESYFDLAVSAGEAIEDHRSVAVTWYVRTAYYFKEGRSAQARDAAIRAVAAARITQDRHTICMSLTMQAMVAFQAGDYVGARTLYGEILRTARTARNVQHEGWAWYGMGQCAYRLGEWQEAERLLQQAVPSLVDSQSHLICRATLALTHLRLGRLEEAEEAIRSAEDQLTTVPVSIAFAAMEGFAALAEYRLARLRNALLADDPDLEEVRRRAASACRRFRLFARLHPFAGPRALVLSGVEALLAHRTVKALGLWQRAIDEARSQGKPLDAALALLLRARRTRTEADLQAAHEALLGLTCEDPAGLLEPDDVHA